MDNQESMIDEGTNRDTMAKNINYTHQSMAKTSMVMEIDHLQSEIKVTNYDSKIEQEGGKVKRDALTKMNYYSYAVSHFSNDLVASFCFTYILYYVLNVVKLGDYTSGAFFLAGQIADGISTPTVGVLSDKFETRFGKRQPYYLFGTITVIPCFILTFIYPGFTSDPNNPWTVAYYIIFYSLLNVGWAGSQISTMSIVNSITYSTKTKDRLISLRNGFTFAANITILICALIIFLIVPDQIWQFRILALFLGCLGTCTSIFYLVITKENHLTSEAKRLENLYKGSKFYKKSMKGDRQKAVGETSVMSDFIQNWNDWLKEGMFYIHGVIYMLARIAVNITMSVMPFYLLYVTGFQQYASDTNPTPVQLAIVPLEQYLVSFLFSLWLYKPMVKYFKNRYMPYMVAIIVILIGSVPMYFLYDSGIEWLIFIIAPIQGVGVAIMLNTATSLISDVIGKNQENSAFVYGCYSFFDKLANGLILFFITGNCLDADHVDQIKSIMTFIPIACSIVSFILTFIGKKLYSHKLAVLSDATISMKKNPDEKKLIE